MLPSTTDASLTDTNSSFLGLQSYTEKDASRFFGRRVQIQQLYQLVKYNTLTLVFGKSGTGKTSLLNAGVFPKLREDNCLPFAIRLVFKPDSPPLLAQVWQVLKSQVQEYGFKIENYIEGETLWEFFHRENLWRIVTPILLFDQLEEIFTIAVKYPERKGELDDLITELADLVENIVPAKVKARYLAENTRIAYEYRSQKVKVIFAFREDFLAEMESVTAKIPSMKNARFRLMPMNGANAMEVITETWGSAIGQPEAYRILAYLVADTGDEATMLRNLHNQLDLLEIEPSLLSQVCDSLDRQRRKEKLDKVSAVFLDNYPKENILRSIYDKALLDSVKENNPLVAGDEKKIADAAKPVKKFIEENLVDSNGFRDKYVAKDIPETILPVVAGLKSRFFIRQDGIFIELTHDVIANVIKAERTVRLRAEARKNAFKKAIAIVAIAALIAVVGLGYTGHKVNANLQTIQTNLQTIKKQNGLIGANKHLLDSLIKVINDTIKTRHQDTSQQLSPENQDSIIAILQYRIDTCIRFIERCRYIDITCKETTGRLNDTIYVYKTEYIRLRNRLNYLLVDTMVIHNYNTLIDDLSKHKEDLSKHKDSSTAEILQRINEVIIHWEPFKRRTLESQSN